MTPRELEEYKALRATIGQRGTARIVIAAAGLVTWAAAALAVWALVPVPVASAIPLTILGVCFEAVFALHINAERIGRYLQVFHELPHEAARWEAVAMRFGRPAAGTAVDPLFTIWFAIATLVNFLVVMVESPTTVEVTVIGAIHLAFLARVTLAKTGASRQRQRDLERFENLKGNINHEGREGTKHTKSSNGPI